MSYLATFVDLYKVSDVCLYINPAAGDGLSSEQKQLQSEALKFARQEMAPHMKNWDELVNKTSNHGMWYCEA